MTGIESVMFFLFFPPILKIPQTIRPQIKPRSWINKMFSNPQLHDSCIWNNNNPNSSQTFTDWLRIRSSTDHSQLLVANVYYCFIRTQHFSGRFLTTLTQVVTLCFSRLTWNNCGQFKKRFYGRDLWRRLKQYVNVNTLHVNFHRDVMKQLGCLTVNHQLLLITANITRCWMDRQTHLLGPVFFFSSHFMDKDYERRR